MKMDEQVVKHKKKLRKMMKRGIDSNQDNQAFGNITYVASLESPKENSQHDSGEEGSLEKSR